MSNFSVATQDQTTTRANTLLDDADDIQKQLDNEARNKMGKLNSMNENTLEKLAKKGQMNWPLEYPECGGRSQSPIDLPKNGLIKTKEGRPLVFVNYNKKPKDLYAINDGNRLRITGSWDKKDQPMIYGGAAHNRRYLFHSLTLHWPSEHAIEGLQFPLESQVLHVSAEYQTLEDAVMSSKKDRLAFLGVVNLFMYKNNTQTGVEEIIEAIKTGAVNSSLDVQSLGYFSPTFKHYASYHGSLTIPPCTEAVLWLIRDKTLPITRKTAKEFHNLLVEDFQGSLLRHTQPLNDRRVYLFN
ncbi:unnamed protein product [Leptosia nina]|uniref:Alpha-carbonic anhydrase domain-containing protein n=1 Tax=Leptosia nina TaxID=320188 RepID=A0AAV1JDW7_9NEOP